MRLTSTFICGCVVVLLVLPGCAAGLLAAGAAGTYGVVKWVENEATRDFRAPLRTAYDAATAALGELGYPRPRVARLGVTEGMIVAGDAQVRVAQYAEGFTRVSVRLGTFASEDHRRRAELLLGRIAQRLGGAGGMPAGSP